MQPSEKCLRYIGRVLSPDILDAFMNGVSRITARDIDGQDPDRIVVAMSILAERGMDVTSLIAFVQRDWADVLMSAGLAGADWEAVVADELKR